MSRRRTPTGLSGILLVDKPAGMTSHDVVNVVRRLTGERRVGHAGTLDPLATGLLVVLVGPATRLAPWLTAAEKCYEARIVFGSETATDDAEGAVTRTADVPATLSDPRIAARAVDGLLGAHSQVPPSYSAIKVGGRVAHRMARAGTDPTLQPRDIVVQSARLSGVVEGPPLVWDVEVTVSKGTYVRALARDLGRTCTSAAHLGALRRTRSGTLGVEDALTLEELEARTAATSGGLPPFTRAVPALGLPCVEVDATGAALVSHGAAFAQTALATRAPEGSVAIVHAGRLLAVYEADSAVLRPATVILGGVE